MLAVICVALLQALIGPVFEEIGFGVSGNLIKILRICIVGIAVLYIFRDKPIP
jgi:hypothetical protein